MKKFMGASFGKILILNLQRDDLVLETIREQCELEGIKNAAVLSGIASADRVSYHRVATTEEKPEDEYLTCDAPIEISSLQGLILDGVPHIHISFADKEKGYSAHLEPGTKVLYTAEILVAELKGTDGLSRIYSGTGIPELIQKGEK